MKSEERVLYASRTHPKVLFKSLIVTIVLVAIHVFLIAVWPNSLGWDGADRWAQPIVHGILLLIGVWYVVIPALQWWNSLFTLTTHRVKMEWGVLYKHSREIDLRRIASISEERGILDRIFGCGTLNFYDAAATSQPKPGGAWNRSMSEGGVKFHDVPRARTVKTMVEDAKSERDYS